MKKGLCSIHNNITTNLNCRNGVSEARIGQIVGERVDPCAFTTLRLAHDHDVDRCQQHARQPANRRLGIRAHVHSGATVLMQHLSCELRGIIKKNALKL